MSSLFLEVVVKVARADAKVCGNVVGGDVALALIVEQLGGAVDDPVSGLHRWSSAGPEGEKSSRSNPLAARDKLFGNFKLAHYTQL